MFTAWSTRVLPFTFLQANQGTLPSDTSDTLRKPPLNRMLVLNFLFDYQKSAQCMVGGFK